MEKLQVLKRLRAIETKAIERYANKEITGGKLKNILARTMELKFKK